MVSSCAAGMAQAVTPWWWRDGHPLTPSAGERRPAPSRVVGAFLPCADRDPHPDDRSIVNRTIDRPTITMPTDAVREIV
jgi:hypothetical protein